MKRQQFNTDVYGPLLKKQKLIDKARQANNRIIKLAKEQPFIVHTAFIECLGQHNNKDWLNDDRLSVNGTQLDYQYNPWYNGGNSVTLVPKPPHNDEILMFINIYSGYYVRMYDFDYGVMKKVDPCDVLNIIDTLYLNPFDDIPLHLVENIYSLLSPLDRLKCHCVCKSWNNILSGPMFDKIWRNIWDDVIDKRTKPNGYWYRYLHKHFYEKKGKYTYLHPRTRFAQAIFFRSGEKIKKKWPGGPTARWCLQESNMEILRDFLQAMGNELGKSEQSQIIFYSRHTYKTANRKVVIPISMYISCYCVGDIRYNIRLCDPDNPHELRYAQKTKNYRKEKIYEIWHGYDILSPIRALFKANLYPNDIDNWKDK